MKMKSFAIVATCALLTAAAAYIAPAMAANDFDANSGASTNAPGDDMLNLSQNNANIGGENIGNDALASNSTNDAGSPDMATGDDDY